MILPAQEIRRRALASRLVDPFVERSTFNGMSYGLSPAGYDIRISGDTMIKGQVILVHSLESFNMPTDVLAYVKDKSSWARRGLFVQNTVIEPGWRGYLTLELTYHGDVDGIYIYDGMPIAQIIFHLLSSPTEQPYEGKYQDQPARAVEAIHES